MRVTLDDPRGGLLEHLDPGGGDPPLQRRHLHVLKRNLDPQRDTSSMGFEEGEIRFKWGDNGKIRSRPRRVRGRSRRRPCHPGA